MARLQGLIGDVVSIATIWVVVVVLAFVVFDVSYTAGFIAGVVGYSLTVLYRAESKHRRARLEGDLFPDVPPRKCPRCRRSMLREASTCPHCALESMPWTYHGRVWWKQDPPGTWHWFDEDFERWRQYDGGTSITPSPMETTPHVPVDPPAGKRST